MNMKQVFAEGIDLGLQDVYMLPILLTGTALKRQVTAIPRVWMVLYKWPITERETQVYSSVT